MDWMMDEMPEEPARVERELVPEGEHAFEIRSVTEGPHKFKEGEFLMLRLSALNGSYQFVFLDIPKGAKGARLAASLAKALGLDVGGKISDRIDVLASEGQLTAQQAEALASGIAARHEVIEPEAANA